jgi:L-iditol 2-dehydrogenase
MKTLVVDGHARIRIQETDIPAYSEKQALVRTVSCGICGTDMHIINGKFKGIAKDAYPLMLGHEGVGEVIEVGSEVTSFKKGDMVLLPYVDADRNFGSAWGAFSEYGVVHDAAAYSPDEVPDVAYAQQVIPKGIDPVDACVLVTLREVLAGIRYFGISEESDTAVFGSGPVALTFIKLLSLYGVRNIECVVRNERKKVIMLENGATAVHNSSEVDAVKILRERYPDGMPFVIDAVGSSEIVLQGMKILRDRGEMCCYGCPETNSMVLDWADAPYNWKLNFNQFPSKLEESETYETILAWIHAGKLELKDSVSDYYPFDEILRAFEDVRSKKISKKAVITY